MSYKSGWGDLRTIWDQLPLGVQALFVGAIVATAILWGM